MDNVFVVNAGSSTLKYQLINMENESAVSYTHLDVYKRQEEYSGV